MLCTIWQEINMQCFDDTLMPNKTHVELKISGWKQDIQQLFNVMDDGRKGYVSGADLMTLQAVDAANFSENDLQVGRFSRVVRTEGQESASNFEEVRPSKVWKGCWYRDANKKKIEPFDGLLLFRTFSRLALYQLFAFNVVKAAKVEKTKSASNHLRGSALTTFCQSYNFDVKIDLDTLFVKGHKRSSKTCKGHTMQIHEMYSRIPAALVWWIVIADSLTNCRSWWKTWIRMAIASVLQRSCLPFNWWQYLPDKSWPNKYAWNMKTIVY